jgi:hypothetical protein
MIPGCEKGTDRPENQFVAKIVGFDPVCDNCIVAFPDDSLSVIKIFGESRNNYYQCVNLGKGEFCSGQMIKVKIRKAETDELQPCAMSDQSSGFKSIYVSDYEFLWDFELNDTIDLATGQCLKNNQKKISICFDRVITDSRCPVDVVCVWAGEAIARFTLRSDNHNPISFELHSGTKDTVINGFRFSFLDLLPYPHTEHPVQPEDYKARIIVRQ